MSHQGSILLISCSAQDRATYRRFLEQNHSLAYHIEDCGCDEQGLAFCQATPPDLILLDNTSPHLDGLALIQKIKQFYPISPSHLNAAYPLPIVLLIAQVDEPQAIQAMQNGIQDYLIKEKLTVELFDRTVRNAIERLKLLRQLANTQAQMQQELAERERAEAALRASESQFRTLVANIPGAVYRCLHTEQWQGMYISDAIADIVGYPATDFSESGFRCFVDVIHPEDRAYVDQTVEASIQTRSPFTLEYRLVHADGSSRWVYERGQGAFDENGQLLWIDGVIFDVSEQKQAEADLRDSEARYRAVVEDQTELICRFLADGTLTFVNDAYCRYFNKSPQALIGHSFVPLVVEADQEVPAHYFAALSITQPVVTYSHRVILPNNEIRWQEWTDRAIFDAAGNLIEYQAVGRDITEKKQAEAKIYESEYRLRQIMDLVPHFIFVKDKEGRFVLANQAVADAFGLTVEELIGRKEVEIVPSYEDAEYFHKDDLEVIESGKPKSIPEETIVDSQGKLRILQTTKIPFEVAGSQERSVLGVSVDITERKQAEDALRKNEAMNRAILDALPDLTIQMNRDGTYLDFRPAKDFVVIPPLDQNIQNTNIYDILPADIAHQRMQYVEQALETGEIQIYEYPLTINNQLYWQEARIVVSGKDEVLVLIRNITERKQANDLLKQLNQELEAQVERRTAALKASEAELQAIFDQAAVGIALLDLEGRFFKVNQKLCEIMGYSEAELLSITFMDITHPDDLAFDLKLNQQLIAAQIDSFSIEKRYIRKDGMRIWNNLTVSSVKQATGEFNYTIAVIQDISDRKRTEAALRESEHRYRTLVDTVPNNIWVTNADGLADDFNFHCLQYFGKQHQELAGSNWMGIVHPDDLATTLSKWQASFRAGMPFYTEHRLRRADGIYRWHVERGLPVYGPDDQIKLWIGCSTDIDDIKQAEQVLQLQANQEHIVSVLTQRIRESLELDVILNTTVAEVQQVLQAHRVLVYRILPDGTGMAIAESVSPGYTHILNQVFEAEIFPPDIHQHYAQGSTCVLNDCEREPIPDCLIEFLQSMQVRAKLVVPIVQKGQLWGLLIAHHCTQPREWQTWEVSLLKQLANQLAIAIQQSELYEQLRVELQERTQAEERLRRSEAHLAEAQRIAHVGSWEFDISTQKITWSNETFHIFGRNLDWSEPTYEELLQYIHPDDRQAHIDQFTDAIAQKRTIEFTYQFIRPDGFVGYISAKGQPVCNAEGELLYFVGTVLDITHLKQAEAEIRKALVKEKELNQLKSRFISMTSHEFRTPLSIISSSASILQDYGHKLTEDKKQKHLSQMQATVKHMAQLLDDVLMINQVEAEKLEFNPMWVDLNLFCRTLLEDLEISAAHHLILFRSTVTTQNLPLLAWVDPKLLRQILTNLLGNAIKYSPPEQPISFEVTVEEGQVIFQVQDRGIGVPPPDQAHLFEPFYRSRNVGNIPGTGLGLTIVKSCVDLHQGQISILSETGSGTTCIVTLPMKVKGADT